MAKILLVNKFYYPRGGDCTAVITLENLLKSKGHEVAIFSTQNNNNIPSEWEKFFPKEVNFAGNIKQKEQAAMRLFKPADVSKSFKDILNAFKPDVVHLHNIHSYLSPVVAQIANKRGIRVVWTMHDYKLICPAYACIRDGKPCELCFTKKINVVKNRCMKGSRAASIMGWMEAIYWNKQKLEKITDTFISPSMFLKGKMEQGGYDPSKIVVLNNFMYTKAPFSEEKEDYYCYAGRISEEKGIETLLESAKNLPYKLKVLGDGPLLDKYKRNYANKQIEFLGQLSHDQLFDITKHARFTVIPSICYDNSPYSAIESLCTGTPVIGARTGGIPELINEGKNGFLYTPGNIQELTDKIDFIFNNDQNIFDYKKIADDAYNKFSPETFYNKLINIYNI